MRKIQSRGRAPAQAERARLSVEYRQTTALKAYDRNARLHDEAQVRQIRASIDEFGFNNPILLKDDGETIGAGHGRWAAAQLDPPLLEVPTITLVGLSEKQWRAYVIADNKLALNSTWDIDILRTEVSELLEVDIGAELLGFDEREMAALMLDRQSGETDPHAEWVGMPEFNQQDKTAFRSLAVHFKDQAAVDAFAELVSQKVTDSTRFLWYPDIEIETYADKRWVTETPAEAAE